MSKFFSILVLCLGLIGLVYGGFLLYQHYTPQALALPTVASPTSPGPIYPLILSLPTLDLELPVIAAQIIAGKWQTTSRGVSYLTSSPLPGTIGNSIFYGHNWARILGKLHMLKPGDPITITLSSGHVVSYTVYFVNIVTPDQTYIYQNTDDYRLTLYTCTGFLDQKRLVVTALLSTH